MSKTRPERVIVGPSSLPVVNPKAAEGFSAIAAPASAADAACRSTSITKMPTKPTRPQVQCTVCVRFFRTQLPPADLFPKMLTRNENPMLRTGRYDYALALRRCTKIVRLLPGSGSKT